MPGRGGAWEAEEAGLADGRGRGGAERCLPPGEACESPKLGVCAGKFRARPCAFPVKMAAPSGVRCGRLCLC